MKFAAAGKPEKKVAAPKRDDQARTGVNLGETAKSVNPDDSIIRVSRETFSRVPHALLDDERLTWKAKGILAYLLGKPPKWKVQITDLVRHGPDGEGAIRAALAEAQACGYAKLERILFPDGKVREWRWRISDSPIFSEIPANEPDRSFPDLENRDVSENTVQGVIRNGGTSSTAVAVSKNKEGGGSADAAPICSLNPNREDPKSLKKAWSDWTDDERSEICEQVIQVHNLKVTRGSEIDLIESFVAWKKPKRQLWSRQQIAEAFLEFGRKRWRTIEKP